MDPGATHHMTTAGVPEETGSARSNADPWGDAVAPAPAEFSKHLLIDCETPPQTNGHSTARFLGFWRTTTTTGCAVAEIDPALRSSASTSLT